MRIMLIMEVTSRITAPPLLKTYIVSVYSLCKETYIQVVYFLTLEILGFSLNKP